MLNNRMSLVKIQKTEYYLEVDGKPDYNRLILERTLGESNKPQFHFPELLKVRKSLLLNSCWWHGNEFWIRIPEQLSIAINGGTWVTDADLGSYKMSLLATIPFPKQLDNEIEIAILFLFSLLRIYSVSSVSFFVNPNETEVFPAFPKVGNEPFMTLHSEFQQFLFSFTRKFGRSQVLIHFDQAVFEMKHRIRDNCYTFELLPSNKKTPKYRENNFILWLFKKLVGYKHSR